MIQVAVVLAMVGSVAMLSAQALEPPRPSFEVASVKPSPPSATASDTLTITPGAFLPGGRFVARNSQLLTLIRRAYQDFSLRPDQIVGLSSLTEERYDVDARAGVDVPEARVRLMLQQLLADRFKLQVHTEVRQRDVYLLSVARSDGRLGQQVQPSTADCTTLASRTGAADQNPCGYSSFVANGERTVVLRGRPLSNVATVLQSELQRTVVDDTGLSGQFDVQLRWSASATSLQTAATPADSAATSIFTAVREQLGLKLEPSRAPAEVLVIDSVERPTPD
jgi:uncharacterized protein (TIGR03435 family)